MSQEMMKNIKVRNVIIKNGIGLFRNPLQARSRVPVRMGLTGLSMVNSEKGKLVGGGYTTGVIKNQSPVMMVSH